MSHNIDLVCLGEVVHHGDPGHLVAVQHRLVQLQRHLVLATLATLSYKHTDSSHLPQCRVARHVHTHGLAQGPEQVVSLRVQKIPGCHLSTYKGMVKLVVEVW